MYFYIYFGSSTVGTSNDIFLYSESSIFLDTKNLPHVFATLPHTHKQSNPTMLLSTFTMLLSTFVTPYTMSDRCYAISIAYVTLLEAAEDCSTAEGTEKSSWSDEESEDKPPVPKFVVVKIGHKKRIKTIKKMAQQGGRRAGAGNYTKDEVLHLLGIMEEILPIGQDEWDAVVSRHAASINNRLSHSLT